MTVFQKQCILAYLGYYEGEIDGEFGPLTQAATEAFQKDYGLTVDGVYGDGTHAKAAEVIASKEKSVIQMKREGVTSAPSKSEGDVDASIDAPDEKVDTSTSGDWPDCPNFTRAEFACKCGCGFDDMAHELVRICQKVRDHFDAPFIPSSGCRCPSHNARSGGVWNSLHMRGRAVDFCIYGHSDAEVDAYVATIPGVKYHYRIKDCKGRYTGYVHMDIGGGDCHGHGA